MEVPVWSCEYQISMRIFHPRIFYNFDYTYYQIFMLFDLLRRLLIGICMAFAKLDDKLPILTLSKTTELLSQKTSHCYREKMKTIKRL